MAESTELPIGSKKEPLTNRAVLRSTFTHPKLLSHLVQLANHAHRNTSEGGFCVQNIDGTPVISKLTKSKRLVSPEDKMESFSSTTNAVARYEGVLLNQIILKPNLIINIHSHPVDPWGPPESTLIPSMHDMDTWEFLMIRSKNKYLIEGIFSKKENTGLLFLYQVDPTKPQSNHYQTWEGQKDIQGYLRLLRLSGIRFETLEFDLEQKIFPEQELNKLQTFEVT